MKILYSSNMYSQQRQFSKKRWIWPVHLAMEAQYYREQGHEVVWDRPVCSDSFDKVITKPEGLPFLSLPAPDRLFTNAFDPKYQNNGNYKHHPGTYVQSAMGCWWGKCTFCVENDNKWEVREVEDVIDEIKECEALGFKEVFDDSGTFPVGEWLNDFCHALNKHVRKGIKISCNMRLVDNDYSLLYNRGFRMLLVGLESANQKTLDKIGKGTKESDVQYIIKAAKAGIECHAAVMFGYPWESDSDAIRTLRLVHWLLRKGYAKTAQASVYRPPELLGNNHHSKFVKQIYNAAYYPDFWLNKIRDIHNLDDLKYIWKGIKSWFGI